MSEKYVPLVEWYKKALLDEGIHLCTAMDLTSVDPEDLFTQRNSLVFIKEYFESLRSNEELKNPAHKFFEILSRITEFRAQHTVSSFLLGIVIKEELSLDVRDWIRVHGNNSPDASFGFFWSLICLTHDVAYHWERNSKKNLAYMQTVETFCKYTNIQHNLLELSNHTELIKNYYRYRAEVSQKIDHGITGAILIYDALMTFYHESQEIVGGDLCGVRLRKSFPNFCLQIADTIALHNMWRATPNTIEDYRTYHLDELIPDGDDNEIVFYKDNTLLFLLGLIDTMDPIKGFCSTEGNRLRLPVDHVLYDYHIHFVKRSGAKKIIIEFDDPLFGEKYKKDIVGMESWLGISTRELFDDRLEISIRLDAREQRESKNMKKPA